jgi:hypothetical protein
MHARSCANCHRVRSAGVGRPRSVTARSIAIPDPLADARGSDRSSDREGGVVCKATNHTVRQLGRANRTHSLTLGALIGAPTVREGSSARQPITRSDN